MHFAFKSHDFINLTPCVPLSLRGRMKERGKIFI
jgi:hypothetical protein